MPTSAVRPAGPASRPAVRAGHTLPELLIVLTILTLFAVLALPRFIDRAGHERLDLTAELLRQALEMARARAAATGVRHQLVLDREARVLTIEAFQPELSLGGTAQNGGQAPPPAPWREELPEGIEIDEWRITPLDSLIGAPGSSPQLAAGGDSLFFYPEGRADSALLTLVYKNERRTIELDGFRGEVRELSAEEMQNR